MTVFLSVLALSPSLCALCRERLDPPQLSYGFGLTVCDSLTRDGGFASYGAEEETELNALEET